MLHLIHFCDECGSDIHHPTEEIPIYILEMPNNEIYFFCCEDCRDDFIKEMCLDGYVTPSGSILRD